MTVPLPFPVANVVVILGTTCPIRTVFRKHAGLGIDLLLIINCCLTLSYCLMHASAFPIPNSAALAQPLQRVNHVAHLLDRDLPALPHQALDARMLLLGGQV